MPRLCKFAMKLDPNDSTPLYIQLKTELQQAITDNVYTSGQKIPTELELSTQYHVSRITVRQAVQELCEEGYLLKKQGKGTFVCQRRISRKLENLMSFTRACQANGMVPSTMVLERKVVQLSQAEQALFNQPGDEAYLKISRLRMADMLPVMLDINYFPLPKFSFLTTEDLSGSLYQLLKRYGVRIYAMRNMTLNVIQADRAMAQQMHISAGTPLFDMVTNNYDKTGALVHLGREYVVADRYHYSLEDRIIEEEYDEL